MKSNTRLYIENITAFCAVYFTIIVVMRLLIG